MAKQYIFQGMPSGTRQEENSHIDLGTSDIEVWVRTLSMHQQLETLKTFAKTII
jgi:hypothetical protein